MEHNNQTTNGNNTPDSSKDHRAQTSPINGAKSKGPKTADGKKTSSRNNLKHGLYSRDIVLATESQQDFDEFAQYFLDTCAPTNLEEYELVTDMIHARWRIRRVERHEKGLMNLEMSRALKEAPAEFKAMDEVTLEALAIQRLSASSALENINRMAQRFERTYYRSKEALLKLRGHSAAGEGRVPTPAPAPQTAPTPEAPAATPGLNLRRWLPFLAIAVFILSLVLSVTTPATVNAATSPSSLARPVEGFEPITRRQPINPAPNPR